MAKRTEPDGALHPQDEAHAGKLKSTLLGRALLVLQGRLLVVQQTKKVIDMQFTDSRTLQKFVLLPQQHPANDTSLASS